MSELEHLNREKVETLMRMYYYFCKSGKKEKELMKIKEEIVSQMTKETVSYET